MSLLTLNLDTVHLTDEQFYQLPTQLSGEDVLPGFSLNLPRY